jgi:hypothetical protein
MQKDSSLKEGAELTTFKVKNITLASLFEVASIRWMLN